MRTTIDKAGRLVIPAPIRDTGGLTPGTESRDDARTGFGVRSARGGRAAARPRGRAPGGAADGCRRRTARRLIWHRSSKKSEVDGHRRPFLDTSVLLAGLIDFGPQSAPAQEVLHAVAEEQVARAATAWHCCLEVFSVATRLPPEFRLVPAEAVSLIQEEIFDGSQRRYACRRRERRSSGPRSRRYSAGRV